jgi:hypothetical protein
MSAPRGASGNPAGAGATLVENRQFWLDDSTSSKG